MQNFFLANTAFLVDALFLFGGGIYALGSALRAVNLCTSSSVKPSKSLITLCSNVIDLTMCTAFSTFVSIAFHKRPF
jgi:hypothetical protein